MLKTIFLNLIKLAIAAALIGWLLTSGKLDFKLLTSLKSHLKALFFAMALSLLNFILISYRWRSVLEARLNVPIPLLGLLKITWIGQFFSSVLPGSVSGDLVKIMYIQKFEKNVSKKFLFASILIDRILGLSGLILLVGISSVIFSAQIISQAPAMEPLLKFNHGLVFIILLGLSLFLYWHQSIRKILTIVEGKIPRPFMAKIISLWDDLVLIRAQVLKAVFLSILIQFIGVVIFWVLIEPFVLDGMNFLQALTLIPIGLMTLALPVAPSGLGVGHAIFQKLFELCSIQNGASLFNIFFVVSLTVNILGVIPYLASRRK